MPSRRLSLFASTVCVLIVCLCSSSALGGSFTQTLCADSSCSSGCHKSSLEQDVCYTMTDGPGTATGECEGTGSFKQTTYPFSSDCSGLSDSQHVATGVCYPSGNEYIMFGCPDGVAAGSSNNSTKQRRDSGALLVVQKPPVLSSTKRIRQFVPKL